MRACIYIYFFFCDFFLLSCQFAVRSFMMRGYGCRFEVDILHQIFNSTSKYVGITWILQTFFSFQKRLRLYKATGLVCVKF